MDFIDSFLVIDALVVIAVVISDISLTREARLVVTARALGRLASLKTASLSELVASSAATFEQASIRLFGRSALSPRFVAMALAVTAVAGGAAVFAGVFFSAGDADAAFVPAIRLFALPAVACAYVALALDRWLFATLARQSSLSTQLALVLLRLLATLTLWLAVMHAGTWLEWQQNRTPLAYGSEWFYAEVYWHYLREPAGRSVSLGAGVVVAWPVTLLTAWAGTLLALKLVRVPLVYLLEVFQKAGRGVFSVSSICIGALAKMIQEAILVFWAR